MIVVDIAQDKFPLLVSLDSDLQIIQSMIPKVHSSLSQQASQVLIFRWSFLVHYTGSVSITFKSPSGPGDSGEPSSPEE
jgi:hypothetical protein